MNLEFFIDYRTLGIDKRPWRRGTGKISRNNRRAEERQYEEMRVVPFSHTSCKNGSSFFSCLLNTNGLVRVNALQRDYFG